MSEHDDQPTIEDVQEEIDRDFRSRNIFNIESEGWANFVSLIMMFAVVGAVIVCIYLTVHH